MKKLLLTLLLGMFMISLCSAAAVATLTTTASIGNVKQGTCIALTQSCANCTFVNVTSIMYPTKLKQTVSNAMTKTGTEYSYTFCNTSLIGEYTYNTYGNPDGVLVTQPVTFNVIPTSDGENNTYMFLILIFIAIGLLMIAFLFENYIFSFISGMTFLATGVYMMIYGFGNITNDFTRMGAMVIIGFGAIITVASALDLIKDMGGDMDGGSYEYSEEDD